MCRAVGPSSFAASDSGFYVCVRCGTQTQSQVEDAAEMGLEEAEGGDASRRRSDGERAAETRRWIETRGEGEKVRLGKRARTAMRDGRRAVEAYAKRVSGGAGGAVRAVGSAGRRLEARGR